MMIRSLASKLTLLSAVLLVAASAEAQLNLYSPGSFIDDAGLGGEWDPPSTPLMTETAPGSGVYQLDFDLDYVVNGTAAGDRYEFKILNDLSGNGANWGNPDDPELTPNNVWFNGDADGAMTIAIDTNTYDDGFFPQTNRIIISDDIVNWNIIGNFQTQIGSATDYNNTDINTVMTDAGGGLFQLVTTIPTPGQYNFRAVENGSFFGIGSDSRRNDGLNLDFNTFEDDQEVTFEVDTTRGAIRFLTEAVLAGDTDTDGVVEFEDDFFPIRDNFLTATSLRSEGDLDFSGFVDLRDFREWKNAFQGPPELVELALAQLSAIPEPSTALLACLAAAGCVARRRNG